MRITNKIMQGNALLNINNNKILQDKLNTQIITQSKIARPSDDPVIALRALRLRTNLSQINQYYDKNVPDAKSWLGLTEDALVNIADVINEMSKDFTSAANGPKTISDREKILESLKELRKEIYATGNAESAGRSLFTGYRTDRELFFSEAPNPMPTYNITETFTNANVDKITYIDTYSGNGTGDNILNANSTNTAALNVDQADITKSEIYRIRLAYDNLDATRDASIANKVNDDPADYSNPNNPLNTSSVDDRIQMPKYLMVQQFDASGNPLTDQDGRFIYEELGGTGAFTYSTAKSTDNAAPPNNSPYAKLGDNDIIFLSDTGEVLLGKNAYEAMMALGKDQQVIINYDKSDWAKGDLIPEHYFECTSKDAAGTLINYNSEYLYLNAKGCADAQKAGARQSIEYNIGFNQVLSVNVLGSECFKHEIGRDVDELIKIMEKTLEAQKVYENMKTLHEANPTDQDKKRAYEAAQKVFDYYQDYNQKSFEAGITKTQKYLDDINITVTNIGSRSMRLDLVENRLMSQQTSFKTLAEENEGIDFTEVATLLTSAELAYEAALKATGKILQTSLLDFI